MKICEYCRKGFTVTGHGQRFCTVSCRAKAGRRRRGQFKGVKEEYARERMEFVRDLKNLLITEPPHRVCERLGYDSDYIKTKLRRMGRKDLADWLIREEERWNFDRGRLDNFRPPARKSA